MIKSGCTLINKVRKVNPRTPFTTKKLIYINMKTIQNKIPSLHVDPYKQMKIKREDIMLTKYPAKNFGEEKEITGEDDFPYKFHKSILSQPARQQTIKKKQWKNTPDPKQPMVGP